jgi:hypothetical protein
MGLLDMMNQLPEVVKYLVFGLIGLHVVAFIFYIFLLAKSSPQNGLISEGMKKLKEAELRAKKGSKLE